MKESIFLTSKPQRRFLNISDRNLNIKEFLSFSRKNRVVCSESVDLFTKLIKIFAAFKLASPSTGMRKVDEICFYFGSRHSTSRKSLFDFVIERQ